MFNHSNRGTWLFDLLQYVALDNKGLVHGILASGVYQLPNMLFFNDCSLFFP